MSDRPDPWFDLENFRARLARMIEEGTLREEVARHDALEIYWARVRNPEAEVIRILTILDAMTPEERGDLASIDGHSRSRIGNAAGVEPGYVSAVVHRIGIVGRIAEKQWMAWPEALTYYFLLLTSPHIKTLPEAPDPAAGARHRDLVRQLVGPARYDRTLSPWANLGIRDRRLWDFVPDD